MKLGKLNFTAGWYRGEDAMVFGLEILSGWNYDFFTIFSFQIAKFMIEIYIDRT